MNLWRFSARMFEACRRVPRSDRGEHELPQAVQWAITHLGERFRAVRCEGGVLDLSARADVASVAERLRDIPVSL
jgi:glucose-1-phosphate thymidylyltransferase